MSEPINDPQVFDESKSLCEQQLTLLKHCPDDIRDFCRGLNTALLENASWELQRRYFGAVVINICEQYADRSRDLDTFSDLRQTCLSLVQHFDMYPLSKNEKENHKSKV